MQAVEELGHFQIPGIVYRSLGHSIIMLKHEVMAADSLLDNGPQNLVKVTLCIQIAIDKMQLCLLCLAYACHTITPLQPCGTLFTTLTLANRSSTRDTIFPVQLKLGLIREEHTSPACQWL